MSDARRKARQMKAVMAGMTIARRTGATDAKQTAEEIRIAALAAVAESRAVWICLKDKGLCTEAQYEDYMDRGYDSVLDQVQGKAAEIFTYDGKPS